MFNRGGTTNITDATITDNTDNADNTDVGASGSGGGILNDVGGAVTINRSLITNNQANRAGGVEDNSVAGLGVTLTDVSLNNNKAGVAPVAAHNDYSIGTERKKIMKMFLRIRK